MVIGLVCGLLVGSFLTVVISRYEDGETIVSGRSHCRKCEYTIRWYDNIPLLSYAILRGKCRKCKQWISLFYPVVELVTASTFAIIVMFAWNGDSQSIVQSVVNVSFLWIIASGLVVIFFYDLRTMHIPMVVTWCVLGAIGTYLLVDYVFWHNVPFANNFLSIGIGGAVGFLFLYLLSVLSRERWMGAGDAYIGLIGGLFTGWPTVVFFLTVSFGLGAIVGIALIALKIRGRKDAVPFAPFLVGGIAITVLLPYMFPQTTLLLPYF